MSAKPFVSYEVDRWSRHCTFGYRRRRSRWPWSLPRGYGRSWADTPGSKNALHGRIAPRQAANRPHRARKCGAALLEPDRPCHRSVRAPVRAESASRARTCAGSSRSAANLPVTLCSAGPVALHPARCGEAGTPRSPSCDPGTLGYRSPSPRHDHRGIPRYLRSTRLVTERVVYSRHRPHTLYAVLA
jgi:hypothetical protein